MKTCPKCGREYYPAGPKPRCLQCDTELDAATASKIITRQQIDFCFKQATFGGRVSQAYCVDQILKLVNGK